MSKLINNRTYRQQVLKEIITSLYQGKQVDEVKQRFDETFHGVSTSEIAKVEQALLMDGLPIADVQQLCDIHAAQYKGSADNPPLTPDPTDIPGHPVHTFLQENSAIEQWITARFMPHLQGITDVPNIETIVLLRQDMKEIQGIDIHYQRKENLFFPFLEQYGIIAQPSVMWGVDDEIRAGIKEIMMLLDGSRNPDAIRQKSEETVNRITEMIFKEQNILLPLLLDTLTEDDWKLIAQESSEYGYFLITEPPKWQPVSGAVRRPSMMEESLTLPTGVLSHQQIELILDTLPIDITIINKDDTVQYFSQGLGRIFPRTKAILGRPVTLCHPPASVHIVAKIVEDFKTGIKDREDFWVYMGDRMVLIRYYALRSEDGAYQGMMEITQDITPIQALQGEKRLVTDLSPSSRHGS